MQDMYKMQMHSRIQQILHEPENYQVINQSHIHTELEVVKVTLFFWGN